MREKTDWGALVLALAIAAVTIAGTVAKMSIDRFSQERIEIAKLKTFVQQEQHVSMYIDGRMVGSTQMYSSCESGDVVRGQVRHQRQWNKSIGPKLSLSPGPVSVCFAVPVAAKDQRWERFGGRWPILDVDRIKVEADPKNPNADSELVVVGADSVSATGPGYRVGNMWVITYSIRLMPGRYCVEDVLGPVG